MLALAGSQCVYAALLVILRMPANAFILPYVCTGARDKSCPLWYCNWAYTFLLMIR